MIFDSSPKRLPNDLTPAKSIKWLDPFASFLIEGGLRGLPLHASNDIYAPSKLACYLFRDGG